MTIEELNAFGPHGGWPGVESRPEWQQRIWRKLLLLALAHPYQCGCVDCLLLGRIVSPKILDLMTEEKEESEMENSTDQEMK